MIESNINEDEPLLANPATRLKNDINALLYLTESKTPPKRYTRRSGKICVVRYDLLMPLEAVLFPQLN